MEFDRICSSRYSRDWRSPGSGLQVFPCSGEPELAKFSIHFPPQPGTEAVEADIKRHLDALSRQVIPPGLGYFTQATSRNGPMGPHSRMHRQMHHLQEPLSNPELTPGQTLATARRTTKHAGSPPSRHSAILLGGDPACFVALLAVANV